jgi:DNA-binding response OmpR family regulator
LQGQTSLQFEEIDIDTNKREVKIGEKLLVLTLKEYELLLFFITNKKRVLTKQAIAEHLWGDHVDYLDSFDFVYQHIKNLRKKIISSGGQNYIHTIYGLGYKFGVNG